MGTEEDSRRIVEDGVSSLVLESASCWVREIVKQLGQKLPGGLVIIRIMAVSFGRCEIRRIGVLQSRIGAPSVMFGGDSIVYRMLDVS